MNKNLTKIVGLTLGLSMAIGVGVGVATSSNRQTHHVYAEEQTVSWTASSGALGDDIGSGTISTGSYEWSYTRTLVSGASYTGMSSGCIQLGKNGGVENLTLTTSNIPGTIKSVSTQCASYQGKHNVSITVGGATYLASTATSSWTTLGTASGSGTSSGTIVISFTGGTRALYIKTITVVFEENGEPPAPATYHVTYNPNGSTSGTVPTDSNNYTSGQSVTVLGNDGSLGKTNYTWNGWNTAQNGSGNHYDEDDTFDITADTTLYAQWELITYEPTDIDNKITWDLSKASYSSMGDDSAEWTHSKASIAVDKASAGTATNNYCPPTNSSTRFYKNSEMTITPASGYRINSIVFTVTSDTYETNLATSPWTNATATSDSLDVTITPTVKTSAVSVVLGNTVGATKVIIDYSPCLSSIALSGTYDTEFDQGTAFSHEGMIVTATYSDSSTANVTSSATWSGYNMATPGNQTVTVTYSEEGTTKTATYSITVVQSSIPLISPAKSSTSGYVGQDETISVTYNSLSTGFAVSSSDPSVVEVSIDSDDDVSTAEIYLEFAGEGTATISLKDGSTQLSTISVTVNASIVEITGLPATSSVFVNESINLGSTITVDTLGNISDEVIWRSSDKSIARVDSNGVVTGISDGVVNITVSSVDYPSATMTCAVTVNSEVVMQYTNTTTTTNMSDSSNNAASVGLDPDIFNVSADTGETTNLPGLNKAKEIRLYSLKNASAEGTGSFFVVSVAEGYYITDIDIDYKSNESYAKVYSGSNLVSGTDGLYTINNTSFKVQNGYKSDGNNNYQVSINKITIGLGLTKEGVNSLTTVSSLRFNYADSITDASSFSNVSIRFGGLISKALWSGLDAEANIKGYGVLVAANGDLGGQTIKQRYAAAKNSGNTPEEAIASICGTYNIGKKIIHVPDEKAEPATATADQKTFMGVSGDYYIWTVKKDIGQAFSTKFNSVAFILVDGDIVFLEEVSVSGKDIANAALDRTDPSDPARPALQFMKESL